MWSFCCCLLLVFNQVTATMPSKTKVLILDIDGTLYEDKCEIESQLKANAEDFSAAFGYSTEQSIRLHNTYGSVLLGILAERTHDRNTVRDYYNKVYADVNMMKLRGYSQDIKDWSGYHLHNSKILKSLFKFKDFKIVVASNSPKYHVDRVLRRLGLHTLSISAYLTPERRNGFIKNQPEFWEPLFELFPSEQYSMTLLDDNAKNVATAETLGISTIRIDKQTSFHKALLTYLGIYTKEIFDFTEIQYLESKNRIDEVSKNSSLQKKLMEMVSARIRSYVDAYSAFVVVDLGAGLFSQFDDMMTLVKQINSQQHSIKKLIYIAYEQNLSLQSTIVRKLEEQYSLIQSDDGDSFRGISHVGSFPVEIEVYVSTADFTTFEGNEYLAKTLSDLQLSVDLIIGQCLADLVLPDFLSSCLLDIAQDFSNAKNVCNDVLLYLPITFTGHTSFTDFTHINNDVVFDTYHKYLQNLGHSIHHEDLLTSLCNHGIELLDCVPSGWVIRRAEHPYMWSCMFHFLALGVGLELYGSSAADVDIVAWFQLVLQASPTFKVANVDILATIPRVPQQLADTDFKDLRMEQLVPASRVRTIAPKDKPVHRVLEFTAPRELRIVETATPALTHGQVLLALHYSVISPGTELKVFQGQFDADQPTDVTIKGMQSSMTYPLRYGYCAVGTILEVGPGVDAGLVGKQAFSFSPHGSLAVADLSSLKLVPPDVALTDAAFAPGVETAVSLIHEAAPVMGERVGVVGAGLVGVLTSALLCQMGVHVTLIDINPARRARAAAFIPTLRVLAPDEVTAKEFDVTIELTGNAKGLQAALDVTGYGGRVVIGSWYGNQPASLNLGLEFHRSHVTLKVSQVSQLSAVLSDRWTKDRRFQVVWEKVKTLGPSQLLDENSTVTFGDARTLKDVYEELEKGSILTALIKY